MAGWRGVNLALPFLNSENGNFSILMRNICWLEFDIDSMHHWELMKPVGML